MLNKKIFLGLKIVLLALVATAVMLMILSSVKSLPEYIFDKGSTTKHIIDTATTTSGATTHAYTFDVAEINKPTLGLLYGNQSTLKIGLALVLVALLGALAQVVKLFNPRFTNTNFVNSVVILVAVSISLGFASNLGALITLVISEIIAIVLVVMSILFAKQQGGEWNKVKKARA